MLVRQLSSGRRKKMMRVRDQESRAQVEWKSKFPVFYLSSEETQGSVAVMPLFLSERVVQKTSINLFIKLNTI
jgi:hypothetical protein